MNNTNESQLFPQLGTFSKLPPEVRLEVWEHLFSLCQIRAPLQQRESNSKARNLSILQANRYLHAEISHHLYSTLTHTISLSPKYDRHKWMTAQTCSKGLNVERDLDDTEASQRYFLNFPHNKARLKVEILAPNRKDQGQIALLWQKVSGLIDRMLALPKSKSSQERPGVDIVLVGRWGSKEEPKQSVPQLCYYDYDYVTMPFCRLTR